ncbi:hypothetical protein [Tistrella bauzanensis]|nr:hypothetical protein [Tistrella bauzanensis]
MTLAAGAPLDVAASAANPVDGGGFVCAGRELAALPRPALRSHGRETSTAANFHQAQSWNGWLKQSLTADGGVGWRRWR